MVSLEKVAFTLSGAPGDYGDILEPGRLVMTGRSDNNGTLVGLVDAWDRGKFSLGTWCHLLHRIIQNMRKLVYMIITKFDLYQLRD